MYFNCARHYKEFYIDTPSGSMMNRSQQNVDASRFGTYIVNNSILYSIIDISTVFSTPQPRRKVVHCAGSDQISTQHFKSMDTR